MAIYKGIELISGKIGRIGAPGINSSGGSDMGSKIVNITPEQWTQTGEAEYRRNITPAEHGMATSPALLAFTAEYSEGFTHLIPIDTPRTQATDGTITLISGYPFYGVCIVAGGISQALDAVARQSVQDEAERATTAESDLQAAIEGETARAEAAEEQALADAKEYADDQIASAVAASQKWLPAVATANDLPTVTDTTKTYLCRVVSSNDVYQCVAGQTAWAVYSDNTDYIDEEELAEAVQAEADRATTAESGLSDRIDAADSRNAAHTTTGTATAYEITADGYDTTYTNGDKITFTPHIDAGANVTLNVNGAGAKPIYIRATNGGSRRVYASFKAGATYTVGYSAVAEGWILLGTTYPDYSEITNTPKEYSGTGQNTDGYMTQKAVTDALDAFTPPSAEPYTTTITWSGSAGNYHATVSASVHQKGTKPLVTTRQNGTAIDCPSYIDSAGNITLYSNANLANITLEVR